MDCYISAAITPLPDAPNINAPASPPASNPPAGALPEYVRVMPFVLPGVVKIPGKNSFEEGAMLEPVNTVLKAVKRLALLPGDNVLVAGQGPTSVRLCSRSCAIARPERPRHRPAGIPPPPRQKVRRKMDSELVQA